MKVTVVTDDKEHTFEGEVVSWLWENPHVTVYVDEEVVAAFAQYLVRYITTEK